MPKYLVLYRSSTTAAEQMASASPEQAQAGIDAWMKWAEKAGSAIVDLGSPLGVVDDAGDGGDPIGGFSVLQADSADALRGALDGHPHAAMGGSIEILEFLPMPGM